MDKQSNMSAVPPYEQHPGGTPSPMLPNHTAASANLGYPNAPAGSPPHSAAHPYGSPAYGAPSPPSTNADPYGAPAHSPPAQQPYGNPMDQHQQQQQQQQPIQHAPTGAYGQQQGVTSPVNEKHEYYQGQGQQQPQQGGLPQYAAQPGVVQGAAPGAVMIQQPPTPLASLQHQPTWVQCPACHQVAMTAVEYHSGNMTHAMALLFFCCAFACCIPYFIKQLKDAEHRCSKCGTMLAVHHMSGSTKVLAHSG